jgi:hypothetical protein
MRARLRSHVARPLIRPVVLAGLVPAAILLAAVGDASAQAPGDSAPPPPANAAPALTAADSTPAWLVADQAGRTVSLTLTVTHAPDGSGLINGHRKGELQIVVPLNWTVQWDWRNADSSTAHSLVVMVEREKLPTEGGRAAFTNAMTRMVGTGLKAGEGDRTTFTAEEAGWYWLLCGVPAHAIAGEYLGLRVDPEARTATVKAK